jgi:hypothetical protein
MKKWSAMVSMLALLAPVPAQEAGKAVSATATAVAVLGQVLYENNFEKAGKGALPDDFLVLEGAFTVQEEAGNKFLELPGAPLDTFGVLFGPTESSNVTVMARVHGTRQGRRAPSFGVGLCGVGGYKLQVSPGKKQVEIFKGDEALVGAACAWESGTWTMLRLRVEKLPEAAWRVEGKVWKFGDAEPAAWQVSVTEKVEPPAGRASIWGAPFAGTPIRFDDLRVLR